MKELNISDLEGISGAGDINWNQVGRDVVTTGAGVAGGAFGLGLGGPIGAGVIGTAAAAGAGALYDAAGHSPATNGGYGHPPSGVTLPWCMMGNKDRPGCN